MSYKRSRAAFESDAQPQHAPYALYGTPLPAYDPESRDDGSYVPIWKQEVTDERGRKRLHGAFTGGYSAGYFNTVGSKEGWAPSSFVSSRKDKQKDKDGQGAAKKEQRAEDFMDEEDLAELAESQTLSTQQGFAGLGSRGDEMQQKGMFADLFKTTGDTMGVKLLQKMGWRQGQGVGPKVKRRAAGKGEEEEHLFAPEDSRMISFATKTDRKGIGFAGEDRLDADDGGAVEEDSEGEDAKILRLSRSGKVTLPSRKPAKKSSFGVGVLNDTGSDDEDPYAIGPSLSYNRIIGGDRKKKKGGITASTADRSVQKLAFTSKKLTERTSTAAGFRRCHDGRLPLEGFVLATAALTLDQESQYPVVEIPEGWTSARAVAGNGAVAGIYQSTADVAKASRLDPKARAAILGDAQLPGKSVFDFLSSAARDRLVAATGKSNLPQAKGESAPTGFEASESDKRRTLWDLVPPLDAQTAKSALARGIGGWMPYVEDEDKRARYRYFLELRCGLKDTLPERSKTFSIEEWSRELGEFAQAAQVFKPVSGMMASRFTTGSSTPRLASDAPGTAPKQAAKAEDPAETAARVGMYGPMTRSRQPFYPTRLLCKRFGIKPPANVGGDPNEDGRVDESKRLDVVSQASIDRMMQDGTWNRPGAKGAAAADGSASEAAAPVAKPAEVNYEKNDALEGQKAGEALFKAIFGSDDEDE